MARVPLTIQALDAVRVSGETPSALSASYSGFVTIAGVPDVPVRLGGALLCVSDGAAADAVPGEYDITCSGRTSGSYDITYLPGTLVVRYPLPTCRDSAVHTTPGAAVTVQLDCAPGASGDVMTFDVVTNPAHGALGAVAASGAVTYTPTAGFAGTDTFTYEGSGRGGTAAPQTVTITVSALPTITLARPVDGFEARPGDVISAAYSCAPGAFGGTLVTCMAPVAAGSPIDTTTPGAKTFTVIATDGAGNQVTHAVRYAVLPAVTTTSVTSSPQTSQLGQPVTHTIEVDALGPDWLTPTGTVTLHDDAAAVAGCVSVALNAAGAATCSVVHDTAGTHTLTATFTPAAGFLASSGATTHTVTRATIAETVTVPLPLPLPLPMPTAPVAQPPACVAQPRTGCPGADTLVGSRGDDVLAGGPGADVLIGGFGDDIAAGGTGADLVRGGPGDDRLTGDAGRDRIFGDAGNDRINGGRGRDLISGGSGNDVIFAWDDEFDNVRCGPGRDTVYTDRVDLVHADCELVVRTKKPQRR